MTNTENTTATTDTDPAVLDLGNLYVTSAVKAWRDSDELRPMLVLIALSQHEHGKWGDVDAHDRAVNDDAVRDGGRVLSAWKIDDRRIWIISEADRSVTTVLFPEDY
jgi:hypothetical protein